MAEWGTGASARHSEGHRTNSAGLLGVSFLMRAYCPFGQVCYAAVMIHDLITAFLVAFAAVTASELLTRIVVFGERHLCHLLKSYQRYYNEARTHLSLSKDAPVSRGVQAVGHILCLPILGGLHHQYVRI